MTTIKVDMSEVKEGEMEVYNIVEDFYYVLNGDLDSVRLDLKEEAIIALTVGWNHSYVHVKPGDKLYLEPVSADPIVFGVKSNPSIENKYLKSFNDLKKKVEYDYMVSEVTKLPVESFSIEVEKKNAPLRRLIDEIENDSTVSNLFKQSMRLRVIGLTTNDLSYYKGFYSRHFDEDPVLSNDFYAGFENSNITDPTYLLFDEGRQAVSFYHSRDLDYKEYESTKAFFKASINTAKQTYGEELVAKYCIMEQLSSMINFSGGLDGTDNIIAEYKSYTDEAYLNKKLDKVMKPWKHLMSGKVAPDFKAITMAGEEIKLSDLRGKRIYVDVWATWCGPCIAEIPALQKLESELHDMDIEFVSISIDEEKDKEKWQNFVIEKELSGHQLIAEGAWKSELAIAYNIKGIPRFMVIDKDGKLVSANAPRPSDPGAKLMLLK